MDTISGWLDSGPEKLPRRGEPRRNYWLMGTLVVVGALLGVIRISSAQDLDTDKEPVKDEAEMFKDGFDAPLEAEAVTKGDTESSVNSDSGSGPTESQPSRAEPDRVGSTQSPPDTEQKNGYVKPPSESTLSWAGGLELDVGYAQYTFENDALKTEDVYDFRGRLVFGPTLEYIFAKDWFLSARGEAMLWVREQFGVYQINVDDVFAQVGKRGVWDLKAGRFRNWRVYHKGLGFDLFTLEDAGACVQNPCTADAGTFGPYTYEVNFNYDRETPGHGAVHVYPTEWSGLELAATYGQGGVSNTWGVRGAAMVHFSFLRAMAAAEFRSAHPREEATALDPNGNTVACDMCGVSERFGFGGGIEVTIEPVEVGFNAARGTTDLYTVTSGAFDEGGSNSTTSLGGYAEVDVGLITWQGSLILGFGLNRTEALAENENFSKHLQMAGYIAYPLGFNGAMVKLVLSRSDLTGMTRVDENNRTFNQSKSAMTAGRLRLVYPF